MLSNNVKELMRKEGYTEEEINKIAGNGASDDLVKTWVKIKGMFDRKDMPDIKQTFIDFAGTINVDVDLVKAIIK